MLSRSIMLLQSEYCVSLQLQHNSADDTSLRNWRTRFVASLHSQILMPLSFYTRIISRSTWTFTASEEVEILCHWCHGSRSVCLARIFPNEAALRAKLRAIRKSQISAILYDQDRYWTVLRNKIDSDEGFLLFGPLPSYLLAHFTQRAAGLNKTCEETCEEQLKKLTVWHQPHVLPVYVQYHLLGQNTMLSLVETH